MIRHQTYLLALLVGGGGGGVGHCTGGQVVTSGGCEAPVSPARPLARLGWAGLGWLGWARLGSADAAEGGPGPALAPGPRQDHRRGCLKLQTCTYHIQTSDIVYRR